MRVDQQCLNGGQSKYSSVNHNHRARGYQIPAVVTLMIIAWCWAPAMAESTSDAVADTIGKYISELASSSQATAALERLAEVVNRSSPEERQQIAHTLSVKLLNDGSTLQHLTLMERRSLRDIYLNAGGKPSEYGLATGKWLQATSDWQRFTIYELAIAMQLLGPTGNQEIENMKRQIVTHAWQSGLSNPGYAQYASVVELDAVENHVLAYLPRPDHDQLYAAISAKRWSLLSANASSINEIPISKLRMNLHEWGPQVSQAERLRALPKILQWIAEPAQLAQLDADTAGLWCATLQRCGASNQQAARWLATVMHDSAWINDTEPSKLFTLLAVLAQPAQEPMITQVRSATEQEMILKLVPDTYPTQARRAQLILDINKASQLWLPEGRKALCRRLCALFEVPSGWAMKLPLADAVAMLAGIQRLDGAPTQIAAAANTWLKAANEWTEIDIWRSSLDMARMLSYLAGADAQADQNARNEYLQTLLQLVQKPTGQVDQMAFRTTLKLTQAFAPQLTADERVKVAEILLGQVLAPGTLFPGVPQRDLKLTVQAFMALNQPAGGALAIHAYCEYMPRRLAEYPDFFLPMIYQIISTTPNLPEVKQLRDFAEPHLGEQLARMLHQTAGDVSPVQVTTLVAAGQKQEAHRLTQELYEQLIAGCEDLSVLTGEQLFDFASCVLACHPNERGKLLGGYPDYIKALAANLIDVVPLERIDQQWNVYMVLATPLAEDESIELLEARFRSADRIERLTAGKVIATVHRMRGSLEEWRQHLDKQLTVTSLDPKQRIELLLLSAYARELRTWDRAPLSSVEEIQQAMALADTPQDRWLVLDCLLDRQLQAREFAQARSLIAGLEQEADRNEATTEQLSNAQKLIDRRQQEHLLALERDQNRQGRRLLEGRLDLLRESYVESDLRDKSEAALGTMRQMMRQVESDLARIY